MKITSESLSTENGIWRDFDDSEFLIAHMSSIRFQRALARAQQPYRKKIEAGTLDPGLQRKVTCQAMAEGIVLDWRKVTDDKGAEVEYSTKACCNLLEKNAHFREFVSDVALNLTNFHEEEVEEVGKD